TGYQRSADQNGNPECVFTACPVGYTENNGQCVFSSCPIGYAQQGSQCVLEGCPNGYFLQGQYCVLLSSLPPAGDIGAVPALVQSGNSTQISWSAFNVSSCSISGTNGDAWSCTGSACDA